MPQVISLSLSDDDIAALEAKRLSRDEPLDVVLRRIAIQPLVNQLLKRRELDQTALLIARFKAADKASQDAAVETLIKGDMTRAVAPTR